MKNIFARIIFILCTLSLCFYLFNCRIVSGQSNEKIKIRFVDNFFENASPLNWEIHGDTAVKISLFADYERESLNRQTDHWYFKFEANKGTRMKIIKVRSSPMFCSRTEYYRDMESREWYLSLTPTG